MVRFVPNGCWDRECMGEVRAIAIRHPDDGGISYTIRTGTGLAEAGVPESAIRPIRTGEPAAPSKWATSKVADIAEHDADEVVCLYFRDGQFYGVAVRDADECVAVVTGTNGGGPVPTIAVAARKIVLGYINENDPDA
jgi:hypothetical protein